MHRKKIQLTKVYPMLAMNTKLINFQRLGRQNRHMGLWPLGFQSYGPFLKSMRHYSNGVGQKKRNIGIFVSDVTFRTSVIQYHEVNIVIK